VKQGWENECSDIQILLMWLCIDKGMNEEAKMMLIMWERKLKRRVYR
jgi:hypothetical protein